MKSRLLGAVCACSVWLTITCNPALASIISFDFSGQISSVTVFDVAATPNTSSGDTFSGSFSFDSETPLTRIVEPGRAAYFGGGYMSVDVNGDQYHASSGVQLQVFNDYDYGGGIYDDFFMSMKIYETSGAAWVLQMFMRDYSASTLSSLSLPDASEIQALMDTSRPEFLLRRFSSLPYDEAWFARGPVLNYNASTVPIPPALYLFGSGLIGLVGLARRKV